VTDAVRVS